MKEENINFSTLSGRKVIVHKRQRGVEGWEGGIEN